MQVHAGLSGWWLVSQDQHPGSTPDEQPTERSQLAFCPEADLQGLDHQVCPGQQPLESAVLRLQLLQACGVLRFHGATLRARGVQTGRGEAALLAQLRHRHPGLGILDEPDELFRGEATLALICHLWGQTLSSFGWNGWRERFTLAKEEVSAEAGQFKVASRGSDSLRLLETIVCMAVKRSAVESMHRCAKYVSVDAQNNGLFVKGVK